MMNVFSKAAVPGYYLDQTMPNISKEKLYSLVGNQ